MPQNKDRIKLPVNNWFAVYTYFRREKSACVELEKAGIEVYVPLTGRTRRYGRRIRHSQVPLIPHYIFVRINDTQKKSVLACRDVIRIIGFAGKPAPVPAAEIDALKLICGSDVVNAVSHIRPDAIGQDVEIMVGRLAGMRARLLRFKNNDQVVIDLEHIGCSFHLELGLSQLRLVGTSTTGLAML